MPRVTVVIPTRNRAHLLGQAARSAARQTFGDLEVLVSDNHSQDDTLSVARAVGSDRVRYVRTPGPLAMPDSWEFALGQARGDWVTFLTDDSYLAPDAVESALAAGEAHGVELVVWNQCVYYAPNWMDRGRRGRLYLRQYSFASTARDTRDALRRTYRLEQAVDLPKFLNCICRRSLVDRILAAQGRVFLPPAPDYSGGVGALHNVERFVFLDRPLLVDGKFPESIGAVQMFNWGKAAQEFMSEFQDGSGFEKALELNLPTISMIIAQSLELMRRLYPAAPYAVDRRRLVQALVNDLVVQESNGRDATDSWRRLNDHLRAQPAALRRTARVQKMRSHAEVALKRLRRLPFSELLERLRGVRAVRVPDIEAAGELAARWGRPAG